MIFVVLGIILFVTMAFFVFPVLSPIPYFPSNHADTDIILKSLHLSSDMTMIDLGAGDGFVIFQAASFALKHSLNTRFVALEINPVLLMIMYIRKLFHPNSKNIRVMYGDMFKLDFAALVAPGTKPLFYMYISPWLMEKVLTRIRKQIHKYVVVSYMYRISPDEKPVLRGVHDIFIQHYS
jgi:16S rRNA A1518/A1519 N6-dimethyltransferase RsmA/KsgA/DIM1 with predicted DNA glycosylase/AP lyase activity